jgi:hypothetical protein
MGRHAKSSVSVSQTKQFRGFKNQLRFLPVDSQKICAKLTNQTKAKGDLQAVTNIKLYKGIRYLCTV